MTDTTISRMWIMRWRPTSRSAQQEGKIGRDELGNAQRRIMGGEDRSGSFAPFSRCPRRVRSTSDCGKIAVAQRTDVEGHYRKEPDDFQSCHIPAIDGQT